MTFQIYCGEDFTTHRGYMMFDIEYYQYKNSNNLWQSELHVLPRVEGLVRYTLSQKDNPDFNVEEFIEDSEVIQELRGWLWEFDGRNNKPDTEGKLHYGERYQYIESLINDYAKKYGCYVSRD
jgi:hypothetical protein